MLGGYGWLTTANKPEVAIPVSLVFVADRCQLLSDSQLSKSHFHSIIDYSVRQRQLRGDLIQTYRIARGRECALDFDEFFELAETDDMRGHTFKLRRKRAHSDVRWNAFSHKRQQFAPGSHLPLTFEFPHWLISAPLHPDEEVISENTESFQTDSESLL
ncbi:hypothetical protein SprV_0702436900 [Sparganum proliferum]